MSKLPVETRGQFMEILAELGMIKANAMDAQQIALALGANSGGESFAYSNTKISGALANCFKYNLLKKEAKKDVTKNGCLNNYYIHSRSPYYNKAFKVANEIISAPEKTSTMTTLTPVIVADSPKLTLDVDAYEDLNNWQTNLNRVMEAISQIQRELTRTAEELEALNNQRKQLDETIATVTACRAAALERYRELKSEFEKPSPAPRTLEATSRPGTVPPPPTVVIEDDDPLTRPVNSTWLVAWSDAIARELDRLNQVNPYGRAKGTFKTIARLSKDRTIESLTNDEVKKFGISSMNRVEELFKRDIPKYQHTWYYQQMNSNNESDFKDITWRDAEGSKTVNLGVHLDTVN